MAHEQKQHSHPMRRASDQVQSRESEIPKIGDVYRCEVCGMEMEVAADCNCTDPEMVRLECCGQELVRV